MYRREIDLTPMFAALGDASADRTLPAIKMGEGLTGMAYRRASVTLSVANVGTPVCIAKILVGNDPSNMALYPGGDLAIPSATGEYSVQGDRIETDCAYISIWIDVTSGGVGAAIAGKLSLGE